MRRDFNRLPYTFPILFLIYCVVFLRFMPQNEVFAGTDYSYFFPELMAGYFWYLQNGLFSVPWFSPSQCGGIAFYPDPSNPYFSLPQVLLLFVSPLRAIQATFVVFAAIGFLAAYFLMRTSFRASTGAAALAATFFMFNSFFLSRMLIGHLSFHAFPLVAVIAWAALPPPGEPPLSLGAVLGRIVLAALCWAYMVYSGMFYTIPPAVLACVALLLIYTFMFGWRWSPWIFFAAGGVFGLMIAASKIAAAIALVSYFKRDYYTLPGIADFTLLLWLVGRATFFTVAANVTEYISNATWSIGPHEWEASVGPIALFLILAGGMGTLLRSVQQGRWRAPSFAKGLTIVALIMILSIPLVLNFYEPTWNAVLKSLPFLGSSSSMVRWLCAYTLVFAMLAGLSFDRLPLPAAASKWTQALGAPLAIACSVTFTASIDWSFLLRNGHNVTPAENAYTLARSRGAGPPITALVSPDRDHFDERNNAMLTGNSQLVCYRPIFGYKLEQFPWRPLTNGPALGNFGTVFNLKNPACHVFPLENGCKPGDNFPLAARAEAQAFLRYQPFIFLQSTTQLAANWLSLITLAGSVLLFVALGIRHLWKRRAHT